MRAAIGRTRCGGPRQSVVCGRWLAVIVSSAVMLAACVQWQPVPAALESSRGLPRLLRVTTRDSVHRVLEDARIIAGDTLVGRIVGAAAEARAIRIPATDIAHLEGRMPSLTRSFAMMAAVVTAGMMAIVATMRRDGT